MKVLVRAPNWVGDAVIALPTLEAIRRARSAAEICILAKPAVADLLAEQRCADRILLFDSGGRHSGWAGREKLIRELRREKFDTAFLLQNAFEAAWIAWRARIPERIGYARDGRSLLLTKAVPVPRKGEIPPHESFYYLELVRRAEWIETLPATVTPVHLRVSETARAAAETILRSAGSKESSWRVAVAPGASYGEAKCWPAEHFAQLADRLVSECAADVIFFGAQRERGTAARIQSFMKFPAISLVGNTSMRDLAALFANCSLFIGNDSGAMHVAAAAGLPVIGIFGPTDPEGTAPLTDQFTLVREHVSCSPCFLRRCPVDHRCMRRVSADTVFATAARWKPSGKSLFLRGSENA